MKLDARCQNIKYILSDVDGVLTDGSIVFDNQGIETKRFFVRDGLGIALWRRAGYGYGILTGRTSHIVKLRADELGVDVVRQGFEDKLPVAKEIIQQVGLSLEEICYIGDDLPDLPVIQLAGLGVAVADAPASICERADYVTRSRGGRGAVRETVEMILKAQRRWESLLQRYTG
ncbi:MAG: phenylphosphate carboxylase subunit delta [Planctomycetaceae bacterium]|nr:phenylphosphate carboxylase subunit delta [Planctomycetaceae bacterium]MBP60565.1 phenylphosphate carboxylase subunit delta [Planctomycetaceae bacterium]